MWPHGGLIWESHATKVKIFTTKYAILKKLQFYDKKHFLNFMILHFWFDKNSIIWTLQLKNV